MGLNNKIEKLGFTLAEMLVVICILSILSAAALPVISKRESFSSSFEPGSIVAWDKATVPDGYHICDGTMGTPDLREYFVRATDGINPNPAANTVGGSTSISFSATPTNYLPLHAHTLIVVANSTCTHTHSITFSPESHTHNLSFGSSNHSHSHDLYVGGGSWATTASGGNVGAKVGVTNPLTLAESAHIHPGTTGVSNNSHTHTLTDTGSSAHTHPGSGSLASQGASSWDTPKPAYYALYYIMKLP